MEFEKYTERSRGFVQAAQSLALRSNHQQFQPDSSSLNISLKFCWTTRKALPPG
jgi:hypothetical protein